MNIVSREYARFFDSPEGRKGWVYSFSEYEFQYDEQRPGAKLSWHRHARIWEMIYIIEGELVARWKENGAEKEQTVRAGDLVEPGHDPHTFENRSDKAVRFIAVKFVPTGEDKKEAIEKDKIYDE